MYFIQFIIPYKSVINSYYTVFRLITQSHEGRGAVGATQVEVRARGAPRTQVQHARHHRLALPAVVRAATTAHVYLINTIHPSLASLSFL